MATVDWAELEADYRGQGIGSWMYRAFTRLAMEHGVTQLGGVSPSPAAVRTRTRVFGAERLKFYERPANLVDEIVTTEEEISAAEARQRIAARETLDNYLNSLRAKYDGNFDDLTDEEMALSHDYSRKAKPYSLVVDLHGLDTSGWEPGLVATSKPY